MKTRVTRRTFLRGATTAAAAAALAPQLGCTDLLRRVRPAPLPTRQIATACELCPNKCAILAEVAGNRVRKLNPNPASPKSRGMLCARGNAAIRSVYDPDRVKQPLIRAGARGEGTWRAVSWDEAFDFAAGKLAAEQDALPHDPLNAATLAHAIAVARTGTPKQVVVALLTNPLENHLVG